MGTRHYDVDLAVTGVVNATTLQEGGVPVVVSPTINDIQTISQAAYDALGAGRPSNRLYLITS